MRSGPVARLTAAGHPLGLVPAPLDRSRARGVPIFEDSRATPPPTYDLRSYGRVSAVKDQGHCGSCWAFATFASLESFLLPKAVWDFSEYHLIKNHGFDLSYCAGGNIWMSTAYLTRWAGPMLEADFPYPYEPAGDQPAAQKHVQDVYFLAGRLNPLDNNNIKLAVMKYGGVYIGYHHDDTYYNATTGAYHCDTEETTNHGVCVIGWDDHFPAGNFWARPAGDGAFIVKNSWGSAWGKDGFFYLSYYDKSLQPEAAFDSGDPVTNYSGLYQYDPLGECTDWGDGESPVYWGANIFKAASDARPLAAVGTYAAWWKMSYEMYVYTDTEAGRPRSGTLVLTKKGKFPVAGYHTIKLNKPITLTPGRRFSVVFKYTTPGYGYPVPVEYPISSPFKYSSKAKSKAGESFESADGVTWTDFKKITDDPMAKNTNVCIKAYTSK